MAKHLQLHTFHYFLTIISSLNLRRGHAAPEREVLFLLETVLPDKYLVCAPQAKANKTMTCSIQHLGPGKSGPQTLLIK